MFPLAWSSVLAPRIMASPAPRAEWFNSHRSVASAGVIFLFPFSFVFSLLLLPWSSPAEVDAEARELKSSHAAISARTASCMTSLESYVDVYTGCAVAPRKRVFSRSTGIVVVALEDEEEVAVAVLRGVTLPVRKPPARGLFWDVVVLENVLDHFHFLGIAW